jgi:hypothetical protein
MYSKFTFIKYFFVGDLKSMTKIAESGSGSICERYGSADPDPVQNITDQQHCLQFLDTKNPPDHETKYAH